MSKTVKDMADEFDVSKQAISKLLTKSFRDNYVTKVVTNGRKTLVVSDDGYSLIKQHFNKTGNRQLNEQNVDSNDIANVVAELNKQIIFQKEELTSKNEQISIKDTQIQSLHKLLDQSQRLQLMAENKIKQLENKTSDEQAENDSSEVGTQSNNVDTPRDNTERGFWSRLFNGRSR